VTLKRRSIAFRSSERFWFYTALFVTWYCTCCARSALNGGIVERQCVLVLYFRNYWKYFDEIWYCNYCTERWTSLIMVNIGYL